MKNWTTGYFQRGGKGLTAYRKKYGKIEIVREYGNWADFILSTYRDASCYGTCFDEFTERDFWGASHSKTLVFWDCDGDLFHPNDIAGDINKHYGELCKYNKIRQYEWPDYTYWMGGHYDGGPGSKNPRTQQEVRQSFTWRDDADFSGYGRFEYDGEEYYYEDVAGGDHLRRVNPHRIKNRRGKFDLPCSWDHFHARTRQRSWKSQRKTQWK
jgi:hypothetical protein